VIATELANFRRARLRCHDRLKQAEDLAQGHRDKLADPETCIRAMAELKAVGSESGPRHGLAN
jgi:hypothetical protein